MVHPSPSLHPVTCLIAFQSMFVYRKHLYQAIYWYTGMFLRWVMDSLSLTIDSASSVGSLVNKLTILLSSCIGWEHFLPHSKWVEFWVCDGDFLINGSTVFTRKRLRGCHTDLIKGCFLDAKLVICSRILEVESIILDIFFFVSSVNYMNI